MVDVKLTPQEKLSAIPKIMKLKELDPILRLLIVVHLLFNIPDRSDSQ